MSGAAMNWAMTTGAARCASSNQLLVLLRIAHHTDQHGRGCYAAQQTIADETHLSRATVKRSIDDLKGLGLIVPGDPERAAHIRADRRPEVWDVPMEPSRAAGGHRDPSLPTGGQHDPSEGVINGLTGGQTISPRGVTVTPKPVREEPGKEEPLLLPSQRIIRAAGLALGDDDEKRFIDWTNNTYKPRTSGWWHKVATEGDLPGLAAEWRASLAAGSSNRLAARPPWCGRCNENTRVLEDPESRKPTDPCPECHPRADSPRPRPSATAQAFAEADAAAEEAKRIIAASRRAGAHQPYRNPADQSVYLDPIS